MKISPLGQFIYEQNEHLTKVADLLDQLISGFFSLSRQIVFEEKYSQIDKQIALIDFVTFNIKGVIELARKDIYYFPSAAVLSRSAFETTIIILWLISPDDVMERERRWICYLYDDKKFWDRLKEDFSDYDELVTQINGLIMEIDKLGEKSTSSHYRVKSMTLPKIGKMIDEIDLGEDYFKYRLLSQYTHSSHVAFMQINKFFRMTKEYTGSQLSLPIDWLFSVQICWDSLEILGKKLLTMANQNSPQYPEPSLVKEFNIAFGQLENEILKNRDQLNS